MLGHIILAFMTFVITNLDDIVILTFYFGSGRFYARTIVSGQYLGIIALIAVSLVGTLFNAIVPLKWISLLGIFPVALGIKELLSRDDGNAGDEVETQNYSNFALLQIAGVTIANGGDNIAVYTPLFASTPRYYIPLYVTIFLILTALWCYLGSFFTSHPKLRSSVYFHGKKIFPWFLILLGGFILKDFFIKT